MNVEVTMIGTGNAFAKNYYNNNALITVNGFRLQIDCGVTAMTALHRMNVSIADIDALLITHIHGDHVGGLEEFAFQMMFKYKRKPVLYVPRAIAGPLWDNTLSGPMKVAEQGKTSLECYFDVREIDPQEPVQIHDGFSIELIPTRHIPGRPSYGILINDSLFYSSDLVFDTQLITRLVDEGRCRNIFHDCQLIGAGEVHATLSELLTLPTHIQERIMLMHYNDEMENFVGQTGPMQFVEQHKTYLFE